jgi:hypothetical protein
MTNDNHTQIETMPIALRGFVNKANLNNQTAFTASAKRRKANASDWVLI